MKTIGIIQYAFAAIGLAMLAGTLFWYQSVKSFVAEASVAQGTVVELARSQSGSDSPTFRPVVRFKAADGQAVEFTSSSGSNPPSYRRGETVEVFYRPSDPQDARHEGAEVAERLEVGDVARCDVLDPASEPGVRLAVARDLHDERLIGWETPSAAHFVFHAGGRNPRSTAARRRRSYNLRIAGLGCFL